MQKIKEHREGLFLIHGDEMTWIVLCDLHQERLSARFPKPQVDQETLPRILIGRGIHGDLETQMPKRVLMEMHGFKTIVGSVWLGLLPYGNKTPITLWELKIREISCDEHPHKLQSFIAVCPPGIDCFFIRGAQLLEFRHVFPLLCGRRGRCGEQAMLLTPRTLPFRKDNHCKYLNISFFIVLPRRFKGTEQEKVKLLLVRYIPPILCFVVILCQLCRNSLPSCPRDPSEFPCSTKKFSFTLCRNTLPKVQIATYALPKNLSHFFG